MANNEIRWHQRLGNYNKALGDISFQDLLQIEKELDDKMLPYKFDLSLYRDITNMELLEHINRAGKVFYEKRPVGENTENLK